ncbi:sensor histidine kinase [Paenibacillus sp. CAA11]|uniref:cache domain-containing sensor histidine kinase n=1 Tax=Paenibacillus sp. CAA11 TaxID=1532905 RepID=UPI000D3C6CC7|nr:sensor histidine kinase [Paenibacillus sp. CAA11]AWB46877.1 sensor histidine kinase [Paenibacillus sp. CAA11]
MLNNHHKQSRPGLQRYLQWLRPGSLELRYQLVILFLLIGILPSIILGFLVNWTVERVVDQQVISNTLQLIGKVNQSLDNDMENLQNTTYLIGFNQHVRHFLAGGTEADGGPSRQIGDDGEVSPAYSNPAADDQLYEIKQFLQEFTTLYPEIAGIMVVNPQGDYISNEMYARTNENLTKESWYQQAAAREGVFTILGHPYGRNITTHVNYADEEVVSVVRSITDPESRKVLGVVLIDLKLRTVAQAVRDVKLGKTGYLMVADADGKAIYKPEHSYLSSLPSDWTDQADSGTAVRNVEGKELQLVYRKSSFTGWQTVGVFLTRESASEVRQIHFYVICFLFLVGLIGVTASVLLSQSITGPIRQLMSFMRTAESGDLTVRYSGRRHDEVGMLGRSFNRMLIQIRRLIRLNELREKQKREAELRSLQANIKPHFLYNTLDTIHWMARKKGADDVSEMVEALSQLFRIGLSKGKDIIQLDEEIQHIKSYIQIQKTRYRDRLTFTVEQDPETGEFPVLKLLLQPVVENAIYHGIKARRGAGHIHISVRQREECLILTVQDNGVGMSQEKLQELREKLREPLRAMELQSNRMEKTGRSYGMLNVQARIHLAFGDAYGIELDSREGEGTKVTIRHPLLGEQGWNQGEETDR